MNNNVKDVNIKNRSYYFFNEIINIENCDPHNIKIDEKSYKNVLIYYIGYVRIKEYVNICSVKSFVRYFQIRKLIL